MSGPSTNGKSARGRSPTAAAPEDIPATLIEQFGKTRRSFSRLLKSHLDLFKAEVGEILGQIKTIGTLAGVALAFALMVGNMLYIGGFLFFGEWLFGSIGWGLAHGVLFGLDIVIVMAFGILGAKASTAIVSYVLATVLSIGLALVCGLNVAYDVAASVAANLVAPLNGPGVVAAAAGALIVAVVFALIFWRLMGGAGAIVGFILGFILGAPVGWLVGGAPWTWPPAAGFAVTIGLIAWPILQAALAVPGLDPVARFSKLYPKQSIEAANETKAWLEEQWRKRQPKLGKK